MFIIHHIFYKKLDGDYISAREIIKIRIRIRMNNTINTINTINTMNTTIQKLITDLQTQIATFNSKNTQLQTQIDEYENTFTQQIEDRTELIKEDVKNKAELDLLRREFEIKRKYLTNILSHKEVKFREEKYEKKDKLKTICNEIEKLTVKLNSIKDNEDNKDNEDKITELYNIDISPLLDLI